MIFRKPWPSLPRLPVGVAADHPFAAGLVDGYLARGSAGSRLVAKSPPTISGQSALGSAFGNLTKLSGSSSGIQLATVDYAGSTRAQVTALLHVTSQSGEMLLEQSADVDSFVGFYLYGLDASNVRLAARGVAGGTARFRDIGYVFPARPIVVTVCYDVSVTAYPIRLIADGVVIYDGATNNGTCGTGAFTSSTMYIGSRAGASIMSDAAVGAVFVHNVWHDPALLASVHAAPAKVLATPRARIWFGASSAGSAITAAAGVATTGTLVGKRTAAATPTAAAGSATAGTLTGKRTAAAVVTSASGVATAGTLTGTSVSAASIVPAGGSASTSTLGSNGTPAPAPAPAPATAGVPGRRWSAHINGQLVVGDWKDVHTLLARLATEHAEEDEQKIEKGEKPKKRVVKVVSAKKAEVKEAPQAEETRIVIPDAPKADKGEAEYIYRQAYAAYMHREQIAQDDAEVGELVQMVRRRRLAALQGIVSVIERLQ